MENIKHLLDRVGDISKKNAEILDATGGRFNMFRVCGVNHYENKHSAIIAEFLNPKGSHGLKSELLKCFIETLGDTFTIKNFDCKNAWVTTEYSTDEGRIDLFIKNQDKAIIIESKINAGDEPEQLKRYDKYAKASKNDYQILYLTLDGSEATKQSADGVDYLPISFAKTIIDWLEKCVAIAARFPMVRETIIQYINHLKQLTKQDMDTKNQEEIITVLMSNLKAAQEISWNYSKVFNALAEKDFNPKMKEFAEQKGFEYHYDGSDESYVAFRLTHEKYRIEFTYQKSGGCYYGYYGLKSDFISGENKNKVHEHLRTLGISVAAKNSNEWWVFWEYYPTLSIEKWESDIVKSDAFFEECKERIEKLLSAVKGLSLECE